MWNTLSPPNNGKKKIYLWGKEWPEQAAFYHFLDKETINLRGTGRTKKCKLGCLVDLTRVWAWDSKLKKSMVCIDRLLGLNSPSLLPPYPAGRVVFSYEVNFLLSGRQRRSE